MKYPFERIDYFSEKDELERYLHIKRYELAKKYCKDGNILDLGCGLGWGTNFLSSKGMVVGVDVDRETIKKKDINTNTEFIVSDATNLPFRNKSFDTVVSIENIEHVQDQVKYIREVNRILKNNGVFIISTPNEGNFINKLADKIGYKRTKNPYHVKEFACNELIIFLEKHGFKVLHFKGLYLRIFPPKYKKILNLKCKVLIPLIVNFPFSYFCEYSFCVCRIERHDDMDTPKEMKLKSKTELYKTLWK